MKRVRGCPAEEFEKYAVCPAVALSATNDNPVIAALLIHNVVNMLKRTSDNEIGALLTVGAPEAIVEVLATIPDPAYRNETGFL